jgi:hypothetical protein
MTIGTRLWVGLCAALAAGAAVAQAPCADPPRPGLPACGAPSRPVALEQVFADGFERGLAWSSAGAVTRIGAGGGAVRLGAGGSIAVAVPLVNRRGPLVAFEMGAGGLPAGAAAVAEYYDGSAWRPLLRIGNGPATVHRFWLRDVGNLADFGLRFAVTGAAGHAVVDDVSVWAPRVRPPPAGPGGAPGP